MLGAILAIGGAVWLCAADTPPEQQRRDSLMKAYRAGNYKDAYEGLRTLALDPRVDRQQVLNDLDTAIQCLRNLGRTDEVDDFREAVVATHKDNWRLLERAAQIQVQGEHYGYIVAGKFSRGHHRGGGRYVYSFQRDRVRALQLMQQAMTLSAKDDNKGD